MTDPTDTAPFDAALLERRHRSLAASYRLFYDEPVHLVRGEGCWLYDADGTRYLDAYNNVAVVGHANPEVVQALTAQAALLNTHTRYLSEPVVDYAERLLATLPDHLDRVIFTCSGSEANDLAVRVARTCTGARGVIVTAHAYHGTTAATAALSPSLHTTENPAVCTVQAPDPAREGDGAAARFAADVAAACARLRDAGVGVAALLVDTILSSEGIRPDPHGLLAPAGAAVHAAGGLVIADEVQAGFGRLGEGMWGFSRHGMTPDLVTMGKPMGNGHPVAALTGRHGLLDAFGEHERYFNTFGGNPVSAAVGLAVLRIIRRDGLIAHTAAVGDRLRRLVADVARAHPAAGDVRGSGLFVGMDVLDPATGAPSGELAGRVVNDMRRRHVLLSATGPDGSVLKIRPPLVFDDAQARLLADTLDASLTAVVTSR